MKDKRRLRSLLKYFVLTCFLVLIMFPFVWILLTPLKGSQGEIYAFPVRYIPNPTSAVNYVAIPWKSNFGRYMLNPFLSPMAVAAYTVFIVILANYVISRFHFWFKNVLLPFFLVTQIIPAFIMLAPLYQPPAKAKMLDGLYNLAMFYTSVMIPFSAVTSCGFFDSVSKSLEEAAWIDGCGYFKTLFEVVVPVIMPSIAAIFIFAFISSWNEFFMAVMFVGVDKFKTIPVGFNGLTLRHDIERGEMAAGAVMSPIPTICLFAFIRKYVVEGLTAGSVEG